MKNFKNYFAFIAIVGLLFTSCSKDEVGQEQLNDETATLSFATVLNDLVAEKGALKQSLDEFPECSDVAPAFVDIVLTQRVNGSPVPVVGTEEAPLQISVSPNPGDYDGDGVDEYFTEEHASLELPMGRYYLDHFVVRDANNQVLWVAPMENSELAAYVDSTLPIAIDLENGVKEYVDVDVICYDERLVRQYGYMFFDINQNEAYQVCFFANFCDPNGRHFAASYEVDVWTLNDDGSRDYIYENEDNFADINEDNETFGEPLCLILPNLEEYADDEDYIFYEARLQDWVESGAYGDIVEADYVINGSLSRNDILDNIVNDETIDYEHLRFGCDDTEPTEPTVCIDEEDEVLVFDQVIDVSDFEVGVDPFYYLQLDGVNVGLITFDLDTETDRLIASVDMFDASEDTGWMELEVTAWEMSLPEIGTEAICQTNISETEFDVLYDRADAQQLNYPLQVFFRANYVVSVVD